MTFSTEFRKCETIVGRAGDILASPTPITPLGGLVEILK